MISFNPSDFFLLEKKLAHLEAEVKLELETQHRCRHPIPRSAYSATLAPPAHCAAKATSNIEIEPQLQAIARLHILFDAPRSRSISQLIERSSRRAATYLVRHPQRGAAL